MDFEQASKRARRRAATRRAIKRRESDIQRVEEILSVLKERAAEDPQAVLAMLERLEA